MFYGRTRFKDLSKKLNNLKINRNSASVIVFLLSLTSLNSQDYVHENQNSSTDSLIVNYVVDAEHSNKFGELVIQDSGGRMKPINTFSSELLRKVSKSDTYNGLNSDQVLLSILRNPLAWYSQPIIYIKRGNDLNSDGEGAWENKRDNLNKQVQTYIIDGVENEASFNEDFSFVTLTNKETGYKILLGQE